MRDTQCCMADTRYLFHMCEVVGLVGAEMFYRKDTSVTVSGPPHIGEAAGGERAFRPTGCYQDQSLWHAK